MQRAATLAFAASLVAVVGAPATAGAADADRRVSVDTPISKQAAGVGPRASDVAFARAAIASKQQQLKLGRHTGLRLAADMPLAAPTGGEKLRQLRFVQTIGGLRVLWSQLNAGVARGAVQGISGTTVQVPSARLSGKRRISGKAAVEIAKRAIAGPEDALPAQEIAYAGRPEKPRAARRAFVVQVAPDGKTSGDTGTTICVVVDAQSGRVLDTWEGQALVPEAGGRVSGKGAQAGETVLVQLVDGHNTTNAVTPDYRDIITTRSPFEFGLHQQLFHRGFGANIGSAALQAESSIIAVGQYWCQFRGYCGRNLGVPFGRFFVTANSGKGGQYSPQEDRIYVGGGRTNDYVMAHEMGHHIDLTLAGEGTVNWQAREIREGIGEMYAYDFLRERTVPGEPIQNKMRNPNSFENFQGFEYPTHMNQYCRRGGRDEHLNGFILANAYHRMVQRLGHQTAGHMLAHMSWRLPVWRTFGSVRVAFRQVALYFYGQNSGAYQAVERSFDEVGVFDGTSIPFDVAGFDCT